MKLKKSDVLILVVVASLAVFISSVSAVVSTSQSVGLVQTSDTSGNLVYVNLNSSGEQNYSFVDSNDPPIVLNGANGTLYCYREEMARARGKTSPLNLEISPLKQLSLEPGTSKEIILEVTNKDEIFANDCHVEFSGEGSEWWTNEDEKGLGVGEKESFGLKINVSEEMEPKNYSTKLIVQCDEGYAEYYLNFSVYHKPFEMKILNYEKAGNKLKVVYSLQEFSGEDRKMLADYSLVDLDGEPRYNGQETISLGAGEKKEGEILFELPKDSFGEFVFNVKLTENENEFVVDKSIFLPFQNGLTSLVISDENKKTLSRFGIGIIVLAVLIFGAALIRRFNKSVKRAEVLKSGHFDKKKDHKRFTEFDI